MEELICFLSFCGIYCGQKTEYVEEDLDGRGAFNPFPAGRGAGHRGADSVPGRGVGPGGTGCGSGGALVGAGRQAGAHQSRDGGPPGFLRAFQPLPGGLRRRLPAHLRGHPVRGGTRSAGRIRGGDGPGPRALRLLRDAGGPGPLLTGKRQGRDGGPGPEHTAGVGRGAQRELRSEGADRG